MASKYDNKFDILISYNNLSSCNFWSHDFIFPGESRIQTLDHKLTSHHAGGRRRGRGGGAEGEES
jgi:hypothetical protein